MEFRHIETQALRLLEIHGLAERGWSFRFDRAKRRAGCCHYLKKRISLSRFFCSSASEWEITNTLLHEIAHALVGSEHNHDSVWLKKAREIGCDGKVTHGYTFSRPRYRLGCSRGCWQVSRHRINHRWLHKTRCGTCGADLEVSLNEAA